jgi:hypothetical protein
MIVLNRISSVLYSYVSRNLIYTFHFFICFVSSRCDLIMIIPIIIIIIIIII